MEESVRQLYRLLSDELADAVCTKLNPELVCEVRIRNGAPICVRYDGVLGYIGANGFTTDKAAAFVAEKNAAETVVLRACERSLYTVSDTIKRGFVTVGGGVRIGVCGSGVYGGGALLAVKDYSAVNIRLPHEIKGCANALFARISKGNTLHSTLLLSPPGAGKTTVLRDLCRVASDRMISVLLCDEKYELAASVRGVPTLDVGACTDVVSGQDKPSVIESGIANMRPDVIMADELFGADFESVARAATCGISVVATAHARCLADLKNKRETERALSCGVFTRFAVISDAPRRDITVYDGEGRAV